MSNYLQREKRPSEVNRVEVWCLILLTNYTANYTVKSLYRHSVMLTQDYPNRSQTVVRIAIWWGF